MLRSVFSARLPREVAPPVTMSCQGTGVRRPPTFTSPKFTVPFGVKTSCWSVPSGWPLASVTVVGVMFRNNGAVPTVAPA